MLRPENIAILWGQNDRNLIRTLGLGPLLSDEFISIQPATEAEFVLLRQAGYLD